MFIIFCSINISANANAIGSTCKGPTKERVYSKKSSEFIKRACIGMF